MDNELKRYYEDRLSMMGSKAWKDLIEDVEAIIASTNTLDGVDSVEKLNFRKGELSILYWIQSLKEISEKAYDELKETK